MCRRDEPGTQHVGLVIKCAGARELLHRQYRAPVIKPHVCYRREATKAVALRERVANGYRDGRDSGGYIAHLEGLVCSVASMHEVGKYRGGAWLIGAKVWGSVLGLDYWVLG